MSDEANALDRFFDALADALRNHPRRKELTAKAKRLLNQACWGVSLVYTGSLLLGLLFLEYAGDRFWWTFPFIYAPPACFALPLPILVGPCLLFARKAIALHLLGMALLAFFYIDYEVPWPRPQANGHEIRVVTNNIGQKNRHPLTPFVNRIDPHIIALQDGTRYGSRYAKQYAKHHVVSHGEFIIASRFPVLDSGIVPDIKCEGGWVAAWADVDIDGTVVKVVNVHIRTPRRILGHLMGVGYLKEVVRAYVFFQPIKQSDIRTGVRERLEASGKLGEYLDSLNMPVIVLGDFNFPNHGWQFYRMRNKRIDAYEKGGKGYGFTFPGRTGNPLAFFRPWLRLDHVFASRHFRATAAEAEPDRESQHRAMSAKLVLCTE